VDRLRADYDATPYTSDAFPQSAPGQLAAIAHVFGLDVPAVSRARVLEIGCAAGGNIIPFAAAHPEALAVGIDLSQVQIDLGRERAQALGLDNLEFVAGDIARTNLTGPLTTSSPTACTAGCRPRCRKRSCLTSVGRWPPRAWHT